MGNLIVKDNALITASHKLGEIEQRLILLAILKAREFCDSVEALQGKELIIHANDYVQHFGVDRDTGYKSLKQAVMNLFEAKWGYKYINSRGNVEVVYERFTQSAKYVENEATVKFMFANAIIPMLVQLERNFTAYEIRQVAELSSQYAMRLYEFFIQHLDKKTGKGWLEISLDELRFRLGLLPTEYEKMGNFKARILDYSINQINQNTDLSTSYTQQKQGRKIVGFQFDFERKKPKTTAKKSSKSPKPQAQDELTARDSQEQEIIAQNNAYADSIGATERHRHNLIKKALKEHREAQEQAEQAKKDQAEQARREAKQEQQRKQKILATFEADFAKLQAQAQDFVCANKHMINSGIERVALNNGDYEKILNLWARKLQEPSERKLFNLKGFL